MLPVLHGFIHFSEHRRSRRIRSAPPEIHVNTSISQRRRRHRAPPDDEQIFIEFRRQARWEKWAHLAHRLVVTGRIALRAHMALRMVMAKAELRTPTFQIALPKPLFMNVLKCLAIDELGFAILQRQGVLRRVGGMIELWASDYDLKSLMMQTLISNARTFQLLQARGEIALRLPARTGPVCSPMRLDKNMTIQDLKGVAAASAGIPSRRLCMRHLGSELVSGKLVDSGVLPGSCVIVSEIIEC